MIGFVEVTSTFDDIMDVMVVIVIIQGVWGEWKKIVVNWEWSSLVTISDILSMAKRPTFGFIVL